MLIEGHQKIYKWSFITSYLDIDDSIEITEDSKTMGVSSSITESHFDEKFPQLGYGQESEHQSESEFAEPANLQEAVINLYLSVKIRKDGERVGKSQIEEEK